MFLRNHLNFISRFFEKINNQIRNIYLNSKFYDKNISKIYNEELFYKPSPHLLSSLIKYQAQKINTLAMIAPITNEEKQKLLESVSLESKVNTLKSIISFYLHETGSNNQTIQ